MKKSFTLLDLCVSSLRRGHANLLCVVPILADDPRRESVKGHGRWPSGEPCSTQRPYTMQHNAWVEAKLPRIKQKREQRQSSGQQGGQLQDTLDFKVNMQQTSPAQCPFSRAKQTPAVESSPSKASSTRHGPPSKQEQTWQLLQGTLDLNKNCRRHQPW